MKRHPLSRLSMMLGLMVSLILTVMPMGRMMPTAHAGKGARTLRPQQDKSAVGSQTAVNTESQAARVLVSTDAVAAAQAGSLDTSLTYYVEEKEANNTSATAQPLTGKSNKVKGNITPSTDVDWYKFSADAGERLYTATQGIFGGVDNFASTATNDTRLEVFGPDGTTQLEQDDDDGAFGGLSSSIAGVILPTTGIYFIKVTNQVSGTSILPYDLYMRLQTGTPALETEPNNNAAAPNAPNPLPPNGWISGIIPVTADDDLFSVNMNAGDSIFISLDANPERDAITWDPALYFGPLNNTLQGISGSGATSPNSEAYFFTVRDAGTYLIWVNDQAGAAAAATYHLSATIFPPNDRRCTTFTSTDAPKTIATGPTTVTSTLNVPTHVKISNLKVNLSITHANIPDLDVSLTGSDNNEVALWDDGPAATAGQTAPQLDLTLDDEAAIPVTGVAAWKAGIFQPEGQGRLYWFKNQDAFGTWTLNVRDDLTSNGGTLNGWGITVCEDPDLSCPASLTQSIYSSDFEADGGNFTHTGTADEWERGTPSAAPINTCHSGTNCWKTDLDATYDASSNQELISPNIDLSTVAGREITFEWAMKYQMESTNWDHAYVEVREVGMPANTKRVFEHKGPSMTRSGTQGNPVVTINSAAGWGVWQADVSEFGGKTVQLVFHVDSDPTGNYSGMAVDDVVVRACRRPSRGDFNGNGPADLSVFRPDDPAPGSATWYINANGVITIQQFGASTDKPVPADYDGDGDVDIAVFRPVEGAWYVSKGSAQNFDRFQWGANGDIPVPGDYDGDGKADFAVFRPADGYWYIHRSSDDGLTARPWGLSTDKPVQADYDGDGKTDIAVFRSGNWFIIQSFTNTVRSLQWGLGTDTPVTGDYDGDRQFDIAVYRPSDGYWYIYQSTTKALRAIQWGIAGDIPVPTDFDADRKTDTVVFRPSDGSWNILRSSDGGLNAAQWGQAGDTPAPRGGVVPD